MLRDEAPILLRPLPDGSHELCHPLGLRAIASLPAQALVVHAEVTVTHLLESRSEVERDLAARPDGPKIVVRLRGPLGFAGAELGRLAPEVTPAQLDGAVSLLREWSSRAPGRIEAQLEGTFVGLTPWTSLVDLRGHLEGLHRHGLLLDPLAPLPHGPAGGKLAERARQEGLWLASQEDGGVGFRVLDEDVRAIVASIPSASAADRQARLKQALDAAAGVPRGEKKKHLRLLPAPRYDDRRPAQTAHVDLTRACNLSCGFCTARGAEGRAPRQRAVQAITAVRRVAQEGAKTLVIGGAEPTLEWYLADLVALAKSLRFERVVLETNAVALAEPGRAEALARAGLSGARVALNSFDAARADAIGRVPGALAQTLAGVRALLDAGVPVELAVALLPENRGELGRIVAEAASRLPASRAQVERVIARPILNGPSGPLLGVAEAAEELLAGVRAAQAGGLALEVAPGSELPPCVFPDVEAVASVLRLGEGVVAASQAGGGHAWGPLCEGCGAHDVCPGPRRGLEAAVAALGRRLAPGERGVPPSGERERVLRELKSVLYRTGHDGKVHESRVLRINFHCNQACDFCFVSRELPPPEDALLEAELLEVARRGASLSISGGEPTLHPRLPDYLRRTVDLGIAEVQLQTNAIKMSDPAYAAQLATAGLRSAFVSLHGTTAATCDRVTAAPGTFVKTVAGIKNLLASGVAVCVNFVVCVYNAAELAELPDYVARELRPSAAGSGGRVEINFSFVAAGSENVPRDTGLIPRISEVRWALDAALARARALDIPVLGFDSQCGVPACLLPEEVWAAWFVEDLPAEEIDAFAASFKKGDVCASCALTRRCYGLRASYAEMYGTAELRPLPAPATA